MLTDPKEPLIFLYNGQRNSMILLIKEFIILILKNQNYFKRPSQQLCLGTLRLAYKKNFWTSKWRRYNWFSKFQENTPNLTPVGTFANLTHCLYEWWKGFVGVPNKSPKAKIPNFYNYFNFLRLSPQKLNIGLRSGRDPAMFGVFWAYTPVGKYWHL